MVGQKRSRQPASPVFPGLHEVVDGVIDRLADQRRAETDGDPEDAAVGQADRNNAAQRAGNDRQQTEPEQPEGAVDEEQHGDDGDRTDQRQAADFVLDCRPRIDGEQAGAGELELGVGYAGGLGAGGKLATQAVDCGFLAIGIGAEGLRLDQQHRPFAVARGPDAVAAVGLGTGVQAGKHFDQFAGRVARQHRLEHHAGRRGEQVNTVGNRRLQAGHREAFRADRRTEQVTVLEQEGTVGILTAGFAILHRDKFGHFCQSTAQVAGNGGALFGIAAFDGQHQETGNDAFLQLIDQHLLFGGRVRGQEKGHVGRETRVPDNGRARQHGEQPEQESTAGRHFHLSSTGSMLITERSPSACRYSMLRIWFLLPLTMMRRTSAAIFCSLGSNVSTHLSCVPDRCSR